MPTPPRTWSAGDPVNPTYLNGDLFTYSGTQFTPTGVRFHGRRPVYKSTPTGTVSLGNGGWHPAYNGTANVVMDSAGDYGAHYDPAFWGLIQSVVSAASGTAGSTGGGWHLITAVAPIASGGDSNGYGCSIMTNATTVESFGTVQRGNTAHDSAGFVVDLVNMVNTLTLTAGAFNGSTGALPTRNNNSDGSGTTVLLMCTWACQTATGSTASLPAPKQSWSSGDTVTAALLNGNTGIRDVLRVLNWPPCLKATDVGAQSVPTSTPTVMQLGTVSVDTYSGWNAGTWTYTVARDGLYFCYGIVQWGVSSAGQRRTSIRINGTDYWGMTYQAPATQFASATKTQIFSLKSGDTVQLVGWQSSGAGGNQQSGPVDTLILVWLGENAIPSPLPNPPDITYRYTAGTPGANYSTTFNTHLANDLSFLIYRPFALTYQSSPQSGISQATTTKVTMDTVAGIVHADGGDNYSGWDATNHWYTSQRSGWYLCVSEIFMQLPTLTTSPQNIALLQVSGSNPLTAWDNYQQLTSATAANVPGATAVGMYYLRAGDSVTPGVYSRDTAAGTVSTVATAGNNTHFECVWISE